MSRFNRVLAGAVLVVTGLWPIGSVQGASPVLNPQIALVGGSGFTRASERVLSSGAVIDTFSSGDGTIKVIGRPGSSVRVSQTTYEKSKQTAVSVELSTARPKTVRDAGAYARSGRSAVSDLIALGMNPKDAQREFGDMDAMDPAAGSLAGRVASTSAVAPMQRAVAGLTVSTTTPYDTQCASVSYQNGEITGYGCSTLYLVAASGGDWWFNNKYKFSAHGTAGNNLGCVLTALGCPWRVVEAGWSIHWAANNVVYDWDPASAINKGSCSNTTISAGYKGFGISISSTICPSRLQPWNLNATTSGAEWVGFEHGTDYEASIGLQALHSPPNAAASYSSPFSLLIARLST
jgi:hypothetical protein